MPTRPGPSGSASELSRRDVFRLVGAAGLFMSNVVGPTASQAAAAAAKPLRVRTITAGVELSQAVELDRVEEALAFLARAKQTFQDEGYEVQTTRVATNPWLAEASTQGDGRVRGKMLERLRSLDQLVASRGAVVSIGPVLATNRDEGDLPAWAAELIQTTRTISFSTVIASPEQGVHGAVAAVTARAMLSIAAALAGGVGNFRFAAAANVPAGTPFFPVAWHRGPASFAIGAESASVVAEAFASLPAGADPTLQLQRRLDDALKPIERVAKSVAQREKRAYLGIDTSPAPSLDRSICAAIEALTGAPFGSPGTLEACATITAGIKSVGVSTCGYSGLMLPVLEDPLLAKRAGEGRYTIRDLLLYSSVCGTGLDVVPIPGDTPAEAIAGVLRDVAALSARLRKPLSARLFVVPGKKAGDIARFDDPVLTDSVVMDVGR